MWRYLVPGDIVDIVATTPGIATVTLERDLQFLYEFVERLGLKPRLDFEALLKGADFFSDKAQSIRQADLRRAILSPESKAIWCIRGGYGTAKLLPELSSIPMPATPKLLIGYSDINCLHLWVSKFWQWPSLHARVLYEYLDPQESVDIDSLKDIIFGKSEKVFFSNLIPLNKAAKTNDIIDSVITGGTMQVLQSGIGLDWQFDAKNKILFLEELFDRGVRLDRTLYQFDQLGLLKEAKAILFGDIICGLELDGSSNCDLAIQNFARNSDIPMLSIPGIGHGKFNHPLPLNASSELILGGAAARLVCSTGGK